MGRWPTKGDDNLPSEEMDYDVRAEEHTSECHPKSDNKLSPFPPISILETNSAIAFIDYELKSPTCSRYS